MTQADLRRTPRPLALPLAALCALVLGAPAQALPDASLGTEAAEPVSAPQEPVPHDHDGDGVPDHESHPEDDAPPQPDPGARPGKPRLDVDGSEHDFGSAIEGERLSHTFKLESTGDADLVINSAKPTCGCTVAKIVVLDAEGNQVPYEFGDPLPKGTELELTAKLDTKNKSNIASSKINIFCNDPRQTVTLGLKAMVDTYFSINPSALSFGDLSVTDVAEKTVTVSGKKPGAFLLSLDSRTMPPGMKIDLQPQSPDEQGKAEQWKVVVTLGPDCREGNLGFPIHLTSDEEVQGAPKVAGGEEPTYGASVMVTAKIRGLISWQPQYLSFGLVRPGQVMPRTLSVSTFDEGFRFDPATVGLELVGPSDAKPDFPWKEYFSHVVRPSEDGKSIDIELTLDGLPEDADGSFQGRLLVKTGHPAKPEVPVLFSGVCRPGVKQAPTPPSQPQQNP